MARKKKEEKVEKKESKVKSVIIESKETPIVPKKEEKKEPVKKKTELRAASIITEVTESGAPKAVIESPQVPLEKRKIVPHLLVQEVESLRNRVESLEKQVLALVSKK